MNEPLAALIDGLDPAEIAHLAACVADGRVWTRADPERWILDPRPPEAPGRWRAWRVGSDHVTWGDDAELHGAIGASLRALLAPYEGQRAAPDWVTVARLAQVALWSLAPG